MMKLGISALYNKNKILSAFLSALLFSALLSTLLPICKLPIEAHGQEEQKTVKVAACPQFFFEVDENGEPVSGYAYDYVQTIAAYSNWNVEYVMVDAFGDAVDKLLAGDIDVFYDVSYTPERAEIINFPDVPMGTEDYYLYALEGNEKIHVGDISSINGLRVGVTTGTSQIPRLKAWAAEKGIYLDIVNFDEIPAKEAALKAGQIDLDFELSLSAGNECAPIAKVASDDYYLVTNKNRDDLIADINEAIEKALSIDGYYFNHLSEKYFSQTAVSATLTADETAWVQTHEKLCIGYLNNYLPFSDTDLKGDATGMVKDLLPLLLHNVKLDNRLRIEYRGYNDTDTMYRALANEEIDAAFPVYADAAYARGKDTIFTTDVISTAIDLAYLFNYEKKTTDVIAVNMNNKMQEFYTKINYPDAKIVYYDTIEDCLEAVVYGDAGSTILNSMRTSGLLVPERFQNLKALRLPKSVDFSFAVRTGDSALYALLNRAIANTDDASVITLSTDYVDAMVKYSVGDLFRDNAIWVLLILTLIVILFTVLFILKKRSDYALAKAEKTQYQKLIDGIVKDYNAVYSVNIKDGSYAVLKMDESVPNNDTLFSDFADIRATFLEHIIYEADRERMAEEMDIPTIRLKLSKQPSYTIQFRAHIGDSVIWNEVLVTSIEKNHIVLAFSARDERILVNFFRKKSEEDYIALYVTDFDTGKIKLVMNKPIFHDIPIGQEMDYDEWIERFADVYDEPQKSFFLDMMNHDYILDTFAAEDKGTFSYQCKQAEDSWVTSKTYVVLRNENNEPSLVMVGIVKTDALARENLESQTHMTEDMEIIGGLAAEYMALFYVNLDVGSFKTYSVDRNLLPDVDSFIHMNLPGPEILRKFGEEGPVHPDDRHLFSNLNIFFIREKLAHVKRFSLRFRQLYGDTYRWTEMDVLKYEGIDERANAIAVGFAERDAQIHAEMSTQLQLKEAEESRRLIERYVDNYDIVYIVNMDDASFNLLKMADGVIGKGEAFKDFTAARDFFLNVAAYEPDRENMRREMDFDHIREKLKESSSYAVYYRALINGEAIWHEMVITAMGSSEVAIGFAIKDTVILNNYIREALMNNYDGIYVINLDDDQMKILKSYGITNDMPTAICYSSATLDLAHSLSGEARTHYEKMADVQYVKNLLAKDGRTEFYYQSVEDDADSDWLKSEANVLTWRDGWPETIMVGTLKVDSIQREKMELNKQIAIQKDQLEKQQEQLERALDNAEVASKSKTNFLFNMSHDIRTPMNAITGFTEMAKRYADNRDKVLEYLDKIDISGQQLLILINQVLEMARIESGKIEVDEKPINVQEKFDSMVTVLAEQAKESELDFKYMLRDVKHFYVCADEARMSSITLNIAGNAMKYTQRGGHISFTLQEIEPRRDGYATFVFTVADDGIGMSEEYLKILFEPFSREKSSTVSKIQGTGLGMSIVKNLVDFLGGKIEVQSKPGEGTRFDVTVDFRITDEIAIENAQEPDMSHVSFEGLRVLLAEDNEMNREIATDILKRQNIIVEGAENGREAVNRIMDKGPSYYDFVLMDIQMPIMDGYEATRTIRKLYPDTKLPIIALSANAFAEDRTASLEAGMDDHIAKPIKIQSLFKAMAKFI